MLNQFPLVNTWIFHISLGVLSGIHAKAEVMMEISPPNCFLSNKNEPGLYSLTPLFFFSKAFYEIFKLRLFLLMAMPLLCRVELVKYTNESKQR